jgi:ceramide glucosyltransferase
VVFNWSGLAFFFVHLLQWFLLDYILLQVVQNGPIPFSKFEFLMGWLFRECTVLYLMVKAHSNPIFTWRSKKYIIRWGGLGEELRTKSNVLHRPALLA